jgi:hypothetical protein
MQGLLASGASTIRRLLMFDKELDMRLCHMFRIELHELHSIGEADLKTLRSKLLFDLLAR